MKLNLGCGGQIGEGWVNVDRVPPMAWSDDLNGTFVKHELRDVPWPWPNDSADGAVFHHVLDMFTPRELDQVLRAAWCVLKPGGLLRISSPDFTHASEAFQRGDLAWFTRLGVPVVDDILLAFDWYFHWGGSRVTPLVSPIVIGGYLEAAGFDWCRDDEGSVDWLNALDTRQDESWFITAVKPGGSE